MTFPANKSIGEKLLATDINSLRDLGYVISLDAGETITGAIVPVALYLDNSDDEVYACDANDQAKLEFMGFGISDSTDGVQINVQTSGVVDGFTGLTKGAKYYVQDDKSIGTTVGTYEIYVGIATSTTEILIDRGTESAMQYMGSVGISDSRASGGSPTDDITVPTGARFAIIRLTASLYLNPNKTIYGQWFASKLGAIAGNNTIMNGTNPIDVDYSWAGSTLTVNASGSAGGGTDTLSGTVYFYR